MQLQKYNYISFSNPEILQDTSNPIKMMRGRMFEYTSEGLEGTLEKLDEKVIETLERLPVFLCSEVSFEDKLAVMHVKFGTLTNITVDKNYVHAKFNTKIDFERVKFRTMQEAAEILELERLQLYRTHWAIRETTGISKILEGLSKKNPEKISDVQNTIGDIGQNDGIEILPRPKNVIGTAGNVEKFLRILYDIELQKDTEIFFRGHSSQKYELTPSLLRKNSKGSWIHLQDEDRLCKDLLISHYEEFQGDHSCFDRLVRMQHYGLPTRLLDISENPLIALFFACTNKKKSKTGEVVIFIIPKEKLKYYDSDTVSCLANISNLAFSQKNEIEIDQEICDFNDSDVGHKLLHHIRSEKSYFHPKISPEDLHSVVCVKAKQTNMRIRSQSGLFLLFGNQPKLAETGEGGIEIMRIKIKNKNKILKQLDRINVNEATVYPSIEKTAERLRDLSLSNTKNSGAEMN